MGNPFQDDEVTPPMPPKPAPQESRRQPTVRAPREYAAAPSTDMSKKSETKSETTTENKNGKKKKKHKKTTKEESTSTEKH